MSGVGDNIKDYLIDKKTVLKADWGHLNIEEFPENPQQFPERLESLFELAGIEYRIKQEPTWMLFGSYW